MQEDTKGETFFKKVDGLYQLDESLIAGQSHSIYIGKGESYLVFKLSSRPYLYLMATC